MNSKHKTPNEPLTGHRESRLPALHRDKVEQRRQRVESATGLKPGSLDLRQTGLSIQTADQLVENVIGLWQLPLGVATNFIIDGEERLIPMVIEEETVIAGASRAAKMARAGGGFITWAIQPLTIAQIELRQVEQLDDAIQMIESRQLELLEAVNQTNPRLIARGGGCRRVECRPLSDGATLCVHLHIDCGDAMGGFMATAMAEASSPLLERWSGGRAGLRIVSNLADGRLAGASCRIPTTALAETSDLGAGIARGVVAATSFAKQDPYRAVTHNKGIMNGVDGLLLATGNDWRAVEAGAHAFASRNGRYEPLSSWSLDEGLLCGQIELPLAVGTVGRVSRHHPGVKRSLEILGIERAGELARIAAALGLAQNLAALVALSSHGIAPLHQR